MDFVVYLTGHVKEAERWHNRTLIQSFLMWGYVNSPKVSSPRHFTENLRYNCIMFKNSNSEPAGENPILETTELSYFISVSFFKAAEFANVGINFHRQQSSLDNGLWDWLNPSLYPHSLQIQNRFQATKKREGVTVQWTCSLAAFA